MRHGFGRFLPIAALSGVLALAPLGCGPRPAGRGAAPDSTSMTRQDNDIHVVGVIRHSELEGGYYAIEDSAGVRYDPTNLGLEFRKDGLPIEADLRRSDDMAGIHMRGPMVEILRIRTRAAGPAELPAFANRVWRVAASSSGHREELYVFLGDGTLLVASPRGIPSLGRWERREQGLSMVEEGIRYPVDLLVQTADSLRLRIHSPGEPLTITLVPAR